MEEVQLKVKVPRDLKDEATEKAKAEGKTMKQVIEEMLTLYTTGELPEQVTFTHEVPQEEVTIQQSTSQEVDEETLEMREHNQKVAGMKFEDFMSKVWDKE